MNIPDQVCQALLLISYLATAAEKTAWSTIDSWKKNGLQVNGANRSLDAVITGEKNATIAGVDYMAYKAKADGEPVEIIYPTVGQ